MILLSSLLHITTAEAFNGDVRAGFFNKENIDNGEFRVRLRVGQSVALGDNWQARARIAGRYSTDSRNDFNFEFFRNIPAGDGLRRGDTTIDELYLQFDDGRDRVRIGRQQTKLELVGVAKKSLDRNDSPNTDIAWTDGISWQHQHGNGWVGHAIVQTNYRAGATEVRRKPLDFSDSGSRLSTIIAIEKKSKTGLWAQRGFDISYLPDSLHTDGVNAGRIEDYWAFAGRLAAQWDISSKSKFLLAGELGYAPNTPDKSVFNLGAGDTGGIAWQTTFNLINFRPDHSIGLVIAKAEAGWLMSPDFRSNNTLLEVRYRWMIKKSLKLEARARRRQEIDKPIPNLVKKDDEDYYLRLTWKF